MKKILLAYGALVVVVVLLAFAKFNGFNFLSSFGGKRRQKIKTIELAHLSINVHIMLGLKTYSRNDFLIHKNKIYFLEANTLPGMTATSLLPQEAKAIGMSYTKLLDFLIENA